MTEEQFEEVFERAQELQTEGLTELEVDIAVKKLSGFERASARKYATINQAAYILNVVCMDLAGNYHSAAVNKMKEIYLQNITIIDEFKTIKTEEDIPVEKVIPHEINLDVFKKVEIPLDYEKDLKDNNIERISLEHGLKIIEIKGEVVFSEDANGVKYQQLGGNDPYKVKCGSTDYSDFTKIGRYDIKYNDNGLYGFALFDGDKCLEAGYWIYQTILSRAYDLL